MSERPALGSKVPQRGTKVPKHKCLGVLIKKTLGYKTRSCCREPLKKMGVLQMFYDFLTNSGFKEFLLGTVSDWESLQSVQRDKLRREACAHF